MNTENFDTCMFNHNNFKTFTFYGMCLVKPEEFNMEKYKKHPEKWSYVKNKNINMGN